MNRRNVLIVLILTMMIEVETLTLHRVGGGTLTWNPNINISDWAAGEKFYIGDWLYFGFDPTTHSILQVNKSSYQQCVNTDFISNVTRVGKDVFHLLEPRAYYFICGRGYCNKGMKLSINVLPQPSPPSPTDIMITPASTSSILIRSNALVVATAFFTYFV